MDSVNTVKGLFFSVRERVTPPRTTSAFLSRGVLTPEEFVRAGDELVFKCPTWSWETGDPNRARGHLPKDKQFLITRNVPCPSRARFFEDSIIGETEVEMYDGNPENGNEEGWLVSHIQPPPAEESTGDDYLEDDFDVIDEEGEIVPKADAISSTGEPPQEEEEEEEEEYADMANFEDENILQDEAMAMDASVEQSSTENNTHTNKNIRKVRTYDISITYDKYYQTPRIYLLGYQPDAQPLTSEQMFQDVMSDYVKRTVTIESHPNNLSPHLSIHPCQHGNVMKNIVENMKVDANMDMDVEMYMFIFLKFVSSIIPTIHYDFTMEVSANTTKM